MAFYTAVPVLLVVGFLHLALVYADSNDPISIQFQTMEETSGRQLLGDIAVVANLSSVLSLPPEALDAMVFTVIPDDSQYQGIFSVEEGTSLLYMDPGRNTAFNREEICPRPPQDNTCRIGFQIICTEQVNGDYFQMIYVDVIVLDINDNSPVFSPDFVTVEIQEGLTQVGTSFTLPSATDLDTSLNNSIKGYTLQPNGTSFSLSVNGAEISLVLDERLDRETFPQYRVEVIARDGGNPPLSGTLTVNIVVTDLNDNQPIFDPSNYSVTVNEVEPQGTVVIQVTATDKDVGENARISYHFKNPTSDPILSAISLNQSSGEIYAVGKFDSVKGPYEVTIEARDHGSPVRDSFEDARVTINVIDTNDNAPEIMVTFLVDDEKVAEDASVGFYVALIQVSDADIGINAEVKCESESEEFTLVQIGAGQYRVELTASLDRETKAEYNMTVNCSDSGSPPLTSLKTFTIYVEDRNDNAPKFSQNEYEGTITENNLRNFVILRVSATDVDAGVNAEIRYKFVGDVESKFVLEENTGIIKAAVPLDREDKSSYSFVVQAVDGAETPETPRSANVTVTINVLDENDERPVFQGHGYSMQIYENQNVSTSVGYVSATDRDEGDNGRVSYQIPAQFSAYPFSVLDDGTIVTTAILDRERKSSYVFNVTAFDHGKLPLSNTVPVSVLVLDRNDNGPEVHFPTDANNTVFLSSATLPNKSVCSIDATDADENKKLLFRINRGNEDDLFSLEETTGILRLKQKISDAFVKNYSLLITVEDEGEIQHSVQTTLYIKIYVQNETVAQGALTIVKGQNILIAIVISSVTFVLSVIIIIIICVIKRKDRQKHLYNAKAYDQQKIVTSMHRNSNRSSSSKGSMDKMILPENGYQVKKNKKEVSFSLDEENEGPVEMSPSGGHDQFDSVSTFKNGQAFAVNQDNSYEMSSFQQELPPPPPKPDRVSTSDERKQRELHRITSLRVHQALIQTQNGSNNNNNNNNNKNKLWPPQSPEEQSRPYMGATRPSTLDDSHSESSGEVTASDSGRGGSEEDIRSSTTNSHDTDTATSHPFYTSETKQPTFSSFRGNSVHKTGPILSSFLNRDNKRLSPDPLQNSYQLNDLNLGVDRSPVLRQTPVQYQSTFGHKPQTVDNSASLDRVPKRSNLNIGNSYEDESLPGTFRSNDDDDNTTTSGSYTINEDNYLNTDVSDMFYKPDTFV